MSDDARSVDGNAVEIEDEVEKIHGGNHNRKESDDHLKPGVVETVDRYKTCVRKSGCRFERPCERNPCQCGGECVERACFGEDGEELVELLLLFRKIIIV
jgi:hypothetical protein